MFLAIAATGCHHQIRSRRRCAFHHHLLSNLLFVAAATFRQPRTRRHFTAINFHHRTLR